MTPAHLSSRIAAFSVAALASTGVLAEREPAPATTVTLAVEDAAFPWSGQDGSGVANDVVRAAFAAAGVELRLDVVPYARCKQMAVTGNVAGCFSMSPDPVPEPRIVFPSIPVFTCWSEVVVRRGRAPAAPAVFPASASTRPSRRALVVGVVLGYEYPLELTRLEREGLIELTRATSEEVNLRRVADGRIDAAIVNVNTTKSAAFLAARAGVSRGIRSEGTLGELRSYVGFSRTHPDGARALAAFETGMRRIIASGELTRIEQRWQARLTAGLTAR